MNKHTQQPGSAQKPLAAGTQPSAAPGGRPIRMLLLDIEGTTCPVSFVSDTLFPYASEALEALLQGERASRSDVQYLLEQTRRAWSNDQDQEAAQLRDRAADDLLGYLRLLIRQDRKLPALKQLQGLAWEGGYRSGALVAPLFPDVAGSLRNWRDQGLRLAVYSSGSVQAQKLLYQHSSAGDLSGLFEHWFDTTTGPKTELSSYAAIAAHSKLQPQQILFISDSARECRAATEAGMAVLFSDREGNPVRDPEGFETISDFHQLKLDV